MPRRLPSLLVFLAGLLLAPAAARADERPPCDPGSPSQACLSHAPSRLLDLNDRHAVAEILRQGIWLAGVQPPAGPISQAALDAYLARIFWTGTQ